MKTTNPRGARQNILEFAARLSVGWTRGPRPESDLGGALRTPLMHVAKEDLRAPRVYSPSALRKRAHGGLASRVAA